MVLFRFSEVGKKGIELPNIPDVHYVNPVLHVMQVGDDIMLRFLGAPHLEIPLCYSLLLPLIYRFHYVTICCCPSLTDSIML